MKRLALALLAAVCLFVAAVDARASAPGLTLDLEGARSLWVQDEDGEWYAYFPGPSRSRGSLMATRST